jgi:alpha-L-fucosidase
MRSGREPGLAKYALLLSALFAIPSLCRAQTLTLQVNPNTGETEAQFAARTQWWREAKFGMFIHWGIYSVPAQGEWYFYNARKQVKDYEPYAKQFDPVKFNARQWVKIAKDAGMKYIVITSKHHDGFCMFDSKLTDYNIVKATPFHRDPLKELAAECRRQGLKLCFYHSIMDWHHPDYLPRRPWEAETRPVADASLDRYIEHLKGQLRELLTNYGPIGIIWFDGGWEHNADELHSKEVNALIRSLQPGILINDRNQLPEDYSTPEQTIPANAFPNGRLWETCMTMNNNWGYARDDNNWKSPEDLIHKLCDIASKGGNFLLNVGPTELGEIPQPSVDRLKQVGEWMKVNSESVYDTTKSPFKKLSFDGRCTQKGNTLYFQVFHWPDEGISLPPLPLKTMKGTAKILGHSEPVSTRETTEGGADILLVQKPAQVDPVATVLKIEFKEAPQITDVSSANRANADGSFTLKAEDADLHGSGAQVETKDNIPNIGFWTNQNDTVSWDVDVPKEGDYTVEIEYACPPESAGSTYRVRAGNATEGVMGTIGDTGDWAKFRVEALSGTLHLPAGRQTVHVVPISMPHGAVMNLRHITLKPE